MIEFHKWTHHSIALEIIYLKSFESDSIRPRVQPQIGEKNKITNRWRAQRLPYFCVLRPKFRSDHLETKNKVVDLNEAYPLVSVLSV